MLASIAALVSVTKIVNDMPATSRPSRQLATGRQITLDMASLASLAGGTVPDRL
jgi:hypothetical protein